MLELTLVRHATTALNEQRRYQGWTDPPLSARGREEARLLGRRLAGVGFDRVVSSDLRRCAETAALAAPGAEVWTDPRLREMDFGAWDGRTYDECLAAHPADFAAWIDDPEGRVPPGGESFASFRARVGAAMDALPARGRVLVVAHGGTLRLVLARVLGLSWPQATRMEIGPCGITRLDVHPEGAWLRCLNDSAHLAWSGAGPEPDLVTTELVQPTTDDRE